MLYEDLTEKIIKAFYNVYNILGYGFLEKVYERSMLVELGSLGIKAEAQKEIIVKFKGVNVGNYFADIIVEDKVILELKAEDKIFPMHNIQLLNYLKSTRHEVGLVLNFGKKPTFKRIINSKTVNPRESGKSVSSAFLSTRSK